MLQIRLLGFSRELLLNIYYYVTGLDYYPLLKAPVKLVVFWVIK